MGVSRRNGANRGWTVVAAGLGLNLAMGVLFAWSLIGRALAEPVSGGGFGWSRTAATLPYTMAIACFALVMVPAGRWQDRFGPRRVATAGAALCGAGLLVAGLGRPDAPAAILLGFGVLSGAGIGLGYASATPAAVKWFGPERKGLITGIVVSGFGLAPVYLAPLTEFLLAGRGIAGAFRALGILFLAIGGISARFLVNPPAARMPVPASPLHPSAGGLPAEADGTWRQMIRTPRFASLYLQFVAAATAGLMIIGHAARIVAVQSSGTIPAGFLFVGWLALFNAGGRVVGGFLSDRLGRYRTTVAVFMAQAAVLFFFDRFTTGPGLGLGIALAGFNYGACLSLFPATASDRWGTKNLGANYGILFTAWGIGGVIGPLLAGRIADAAGSYGPAFRAAGTMMLVAALLAAGTRFPRPLRLKE
ncbi:MAG: OFA family MFS transporter [Candidatus Aminicenantes bacterium]|nr:OFA family MFS transporter [Candidatus Aminicenantes bacterium]